MASFSSTIEIPRDLATVWKGLTDYSSWAAWFSVMGRKIDRSNLLVDNQGKGDVVRCFIDAKNYADFEVVHGEKKLAIRLLRIQSQLKENVQAHALFTLATQGKNTLVENTISIEVQGMLGMVRPLISLKGKAIQRENLERFKQYLKTQ